MFLNFTASIIFELMIFLGVLVSVIWGVPHKFLMFFTVMVIVVPLVLLVLKKFLNREKKRDKSSIGLMLRIMNFLIMIISIVLIYSLIRFMFLLSDAGLKMSMRSAVFYMSSSTACICLKVMALWLNTIYRNLRGD